MATTERQQALLDVCDKRAEKAASHGQHETAEKWSAFGINVATGTLGQERHTQSGKANSRARRVLSAIGEYMQRARGRSAGHPMFRDRGVAS